jgi:hypothetical protein
VAVFAIARLAYDASHGGKTTNTTRSKRMNAYTTDTPRAAFALAAVGLAALTLCTFVVGPAVLDSGFAPDTYARTTGPVEVAITPSRIEVVGARDPNVAWALPHSEPCKPQG